MKVRPASELVWLRLSSREELIFSRQVVDGHGGLGSVGRGVGDRGDDAGGHVEAARIAILAIVRGD